MLWTTLLNVSFVLKFVLFLFRFLFFFFFKMDSQLKFDSFELWKKRYLFFWYLSLSWLNFMNHVPRKRLIKPLSKKIYWRFFFPASEQSISIKILKWKPSRWFSQDIFRIAKGWIKKNFFGSRERKTWVFHHVSYKVSIKMRNLIMTKSFILKLKFSERALSLTIFLEIKGPIKIIHLTKLSSPRSLLFLPRGIYFFLNLIRIWLSIIFNTFKNLFSNQHAIIRVHKSFTPCLLEHPVTKVISFSKQNQFFKR